MNYVLLPLAKGSTLDFPTLKLSADTGRDCQSRSTREKVEVRHGGAAQTPCSDGSEGNGKDVDKGTKRRRGG